MTEEVKDYIDQHIRLSTDSSSRAITSMLGYLQTTIATIDSKMDSHKQEEIASRVTYREAMLAGVKEEIKTTVNGKIDRIDKKLDAHIADVTPIIKEYKDNNTTKKVLKKKIVPVIATASSIAILYGGWEALKSFIGFK